MSNKISKNKAFFSEKESIFGAKADQKFMKAALAQAHKAAALDEVPVGAVIVDAQGAIISRGYNKVESCNSQVAHAELRALLKATRIRKNWRLTGCWIYVTLEPCVMCIGLIINSRITGVVYGAQSFLFGYSLDKHIASWVYRKNAFRVINGVCSQEAVVLLKDFFSKKRESS